MNLRDHRTEEDITLDAERSGSGDCALQFSPAISFAAEVMSVEMNGHLLQHRVLKSVVDQHVSMRFPLAHGSNKVHISIRNDFGLSLTSTLPGLGATSCGLRVLWETWSAARDRLELEVAGISGSVYELGIWNGKGLKSVDGAEWIRGADPGKLRIHMPASGSEGYARGKIVFHFAEKRAAEHGKGTDN